MVGVADIEVLTRGNIPVAAVDEAATKVRGLARYTRRPITQARVRLTRLPDPAVANPVVAQGNLYLDGRLARARVAATTAHEAVDLLQARLRRRLARLAQHWSPRRGGPPGNDPHPPADRIIVRHEAYAHGRATPDEAVSDMDLMGYDFHLFTDDRTGHDAIVYRAGPTGYRLAELVPAPPPRPVPAAPLTISRRPVPRLHLPQAVALLEATGWPFLFYAIPATGRGRVLYRRHDGDYGLVTPARAR